MKKTFACILNLNLPTYTDWLYESLKPFEGQGNYDITVIDNGSTEKGKSKYTGFSLDSNVYFGGGFQSAVEYVLSSDEYDSLLFLNNDLTLHGNGFVKTLRDEMFNGNYGIISPTFINIDPDPIKQCHWKSMLNYYSTGVRDVPFIDLQGPLIRRDVLERYIKFETLPDLLYGWGIDALLAIICAHDSIKMGVVDRVSMLHHNSLTVRSGVSDLTIQTYCQLAEKGQFNFFSRNNMLKEFMEIRKKGESYNV